MTGRVRGNDGAGIARAAANDVGDLSAAVEASARESAAPARSTPDRNQDIAMTIKIATSADRAARIPTDDAEGTGATAAAAAAAVAAAGALVDGAAAPPTPALDFAADAAERAAAAAAEGVAARFRDVAGVATAGAGDFDTFRGVFRAGVARDELVACSWDVPK